MALLLTIAVGIGSNATLYGFIRGLASRGSLPHSGLAPETARGLAHVGTLLRFGAGLVFFTACVNVATFLLGRAAARMKEISLRVALGAGPGRLARSALCDSIVVSLSGGALGALLALWTSKVIPALLFEEDAASLVHGANASSILAASAAGMAIIIICGLLPLVETPHDRPAAVLQRENAGPSRMARTIRSALIVAQMACCSMLVIAAALLYGGLRTALQTPVSRRLGPAILATVQSDPVVGMRYFRDIESAARTIGGISPVAWGSRLAGSEPVWASFRIDPPHLPERDVSLDAARFPSDPATLFTLPPRVGRLFGFADGSCRVAIVNQQGADTLFGDATVGRSIRDALGMPIEIIGIAKLRDGARARPAIYFRTAQALETTATRFRAPIAAALRTAQLTVNVVSPEWFDAMGFTLTAGRSFDPSAGRGCRVAIVNQEAAAQWFGGKAVGTSVIDDAGHRTEIIGVMRSAPLVTFERHPEPAIYFPMAQELPQRLTLIVRTRAISEPVLTALHRALDSVPGRCLSVPCASLPSVESLDRYLRRTALAPLRIATLIIGACATLGILLGTLGLYGALTDAARERRHTLAVCIAIGARRRDVIRRILGEGGRLAAAGTVAGLLASLVLSRFLRLIQPGMGPPKLWVWVAGPVFLALVVAIAGVLPARRALMVHPVTILRDNT